MNDIDTLLEQERPQLTIEERAALLRAIEAEVALPTPSPYVSFLYRRATVALMAVLILALGASGTVLASEDAKPGDLLFPIERAREEVQLVLASDARKAELRAQFTTERLEELRRILEEENNDSLDDSSTTTDDSLVTVDAEGEARIGSAVQVLLDYIEGVENDDVRDNFLKAMLVEIGTVKVHGRASGNDDSSRSDNFRLEVKDDRIEVREDGYRIRIEDDGEVRIKEDDDFFKEEHKSGGDDDGYKTSSYDSDDHDWEEEDDNREDREDRNDEYEDRDDDEDDHQGGDEDSDVRIQEMDDDSNVPSVKKFEVRVEGGRAEVRIEYGEQKDEYETTYDTEESLVVEAAARTGLPIEVLLRALDIEIDD